MAALSLIKQLNNESSIHDELTYSEFLGEKKLAILESFLVSHGITSLTEVDQAICSSFCFYICNHAELSAGQRNAYKSTLETAIRCYYESEHTTVIDEIDELDLREDIRSKVIFFLSIHHINHISEIDASLRQQFVSYLDYIGYSKSSEIIRGFDSLKIHSIKEDMTSLREKKLTYKDELLYLGYHPNYEIASKYLYTQKRDPLFFDFSLDVSETMKRQIFETLNFVTTEYNDRDNHYRIQHFILPLWNLYNFCVEHKVADMTQFTSIQESVYHAYLLKSSTHQMRDDRHIIGIVRKHLFLSAPAINWDANVWYFERFTFTTGRMNEASPIEALYFDSCRIRDNTKCFKDYMKYLIGLSPRYSIQSVFLSYQTIKEFILFLDQEKVLLRDIKAELLDRYINEYYLREVAPNTINLMLGRLSKFIDYLLSKRMMNPILFPFETYRMKEIIHHNDLSVDETYIDNVLSVLQNFPEHLRLMFLNLWCIGLRANEVCTIKGGAYSFDGTDAWFLVYQAKAKHEKRVPIPMELYKMMTSYINKHHIEKDEFVFQAPTAKGAYRVGTFTKQISNLLKKYGIDFRSHSFRHTIASELHTGGAQIQTIREYLGHSNENMTMQYIDHLPNEIDALSQDFFKKQETKQPWNIV